MDNKDLEKFIELCKHCKFKLSGLDSDYIIEGKNLNIDDFNKLGYGEIEVNLGFCPSL